MDQGNTLKARSVPFSLSTYFPAGLRTLMSGSEDKRHRPSKATTSSSFSPKLRALCISLHATLAAILAAVLVIYSRHYEHAVTMNIDNFTTTYLPSIITASLQIFGTVPHLSARHVDSDLISRTSDLSRCHCHDHTAPHTAQRPMYPSNAYSNSRQKLRVVRSWICSGFVMAADTAALCTRSYYRHHRISVWNFGIAYKHPCIIARRTFQRDNIRYICEHAS